MTESATRSRRPKRRRVATERELDLMTVSELAAALRLTPRSVYQMVGRDEVPGVLRIGKRLRFDRQVIASWVRGCRA